MDDTDKLVAAIFAAAMCVGGKEADHKVYLTHYDIFLELMAKRGKPQPPEKPQLTRQQQLMKHALDE